MQLGHELQVAHQGAQLGGRAQVQPRALVHVEGLVDVVGLDAQQVGPGAALEQREAVDQRAGVGARVEHVGADQPRGLRRGGRAQPGQHARHERLCFAVQAGFGLEIEALQVVGPRHVEQRADVGAQRGRGLALHEVGPGRGRQRGLQVQGQRQRRIAQRGRDQACLGHQPQVAVGQPGQTRAVAEQMLRRAALRDHQRQRLLEGLGLLPQRLVRGRCRLFRLVGQQAVDLAEVAPVPGPQAVAQPVHLAHARARGQRHGVEVVDDDLAAPRLRVVAVLVGAQRGRRHLAQLVAD
ncbi:hypothetical protein D9M68_557600 [compost metagenome]